MRLSKILLFCVILIFALSNVGCNKSLNESIAGFEIIGNKVCLISNSKKIYQNSTYYRCNIYIIDAENGSLLHNSFLGENITLVSHRDALVLFKEKSGFILFDIEKASIVKKYDIAYFEKFYNQNNIGINSIDIQKDILVVVMKDGTSFNFCPFLEKIIPKPDADYFRYINYTFHINAIEYTENGRSKELYKFKRIDNNDLKRFLYKVNYNNEENTLVSNVGFIEGECIGYFPEDNLIFMKSFENTDRQKIIITALDMDLKKKWEIVQNQIEIEQNTQYEIISECKKYKTYYFFAFNNTLVKINEEGKVLWKNKYF